MAHGHTFLLYGWRFNKGLGCESARLEFMDWCFPGGVGRLTSPGCDKERILRLAQYSVYITQGG